MARLMNGPYVRVVAAIVTDSPQCSAESGADLASPRDVRRRPGCGEE